jgi:hypothetical protein
MGQVGFRDSKRSLAWILGAFMLLLLCSLSGCSIGAADGEAKAIALVQNYQIRGKDVRERLLDAVVYSTSKKIEGIEWRARKEGENIYTVTCTVKVGNGDRHFVWYANLSSKRISPLDLDTQDVMGGGFY